MEPSTNTNMNLVKIINKSSPSESSAGSPQSTAGEEEKTADFLLDLSSEDLCRMLDSDFAAKLNDVELNDVNNHPTMNAGDGGGGDHKPVLPPEGLENNYNSGTGSELCGQANNMVSDFRSLFLESDDGWLGNDIDILFSD